MSMGEVADRAGPEALLLGSFTFQRGQPADAVALEAAVERRSGQVRDRRLERVETVVQRQQRVSTERHAHGLLLGRKGGGMNGPRPLRASVARYAAAANQASMADDAIAALSRRATSNLPPRLDTGTAKKFLISAASSAKMVTPTGIEPVFQP